ncbi:MAG: hypothetical protein WA672_11675 [Candidatus Angelobacter sp.]
MFQLLRNECKRLPGNFGPMWGRQRQNSDAQALKTYHRCLSPLRHFVVAPRQLHFSGATMFFGINWCACVAAETITTKLQLRDGIRNKLRLLHRPKSLWSVNMAALPEESGCWLDSDSMAGVSIRQDVRTAAGEVWKIACEKTRLAMGDTSETAALMEAAAARASRFLDRLGQAAASASAQAVLLSIFCRLLYRRAGRLRRLEFVGLDVGVKTTVPSWEDEMNMLLFFEKLQHHLSPESVTILGLRRNGHFWNEIASMLQVSIPAVKKRFWRDIENAKAALRIGSQGKPAGRAGFGRRGQGNGSVG